MHQACAWYEIAYILLPIYLSNCLLFLKRVEKLMNFSFFVLLITDSVKKGGLYSQPIARLMKDHLCQVRAIATPEISHRPQNVFWLQIQNFT